MIEELKNKVEFVVWPNGRRMAKGLSAIEKIFGVSYITATRYSKTILKDAVLKKGNMHWVDIDKAIQIISNADEDNEK